MSSWSALTITLTLLAPAAPATAAYEAPTWSVEFVLPDEEQRGASFAVQDPVLSDGLMPQYRIATPYGEMSAYGHRQFNERLREIKALEIARSTSDLEVVAGTAKRQVEGTLKTVVGAARDPVGLVQGLPRGIVNLFRGTAAQAKQWGRDANRAAKKSQQGKTSGDKTTVQQKATRYAQRYLGISAGERSWFERLGVDPYTDNDSLRDEVRRLANVEAATALGLRLASLPSIPYTGDLRRVMDAVYHEDPAVLRERRRDTLLGYGLSADEVDRFENTPAMSPTRQLRLATAAEHLHGVVGLATVFRQSAQLLSSDEAEIYVAGVEYLGRLHAQRPLGEVIASLRLPAAIYADRQGCVVVAAVESVFWTALTDSGERALHAGLPVLPSAPDIWITGYVSDEAHRQLTSRGWVVKAYAFDDLP